MFYLEIILILAGAYLVGAIPTAVWIGRAFYKIDVREHGSGNAGATNTIRVLGWKAGIPVLLFDVVKGWAAVQLSLLFPPPVMEYDLWVYFRIALGILAVIGHVFPVYTGFRGGKGVATLLGVGIALYPVSIWIVTGLFFITLLVSGYVSLGSMIAGIAFPFVVVFLIAEDHAGLVILSIAVALFLPLTHTKNIRRLVRGEESKFRPRRRKNE